MDPSWRSRKLDLQQNLETKRGVNEDNEKDEGYRGEGQEGAASQTMPPPSSRPHNNGLNKHLHIYRLLDLSLAGFTSKQSTRFILCGRQAGLRVRDLVPPETWSYPGPGPGTG